MKIDDFKLERYFAKYEFEAKYLLSSSDCDGYDLKYILQTASNGEIDLWNNMKLGYTESKGNPILRKSILNYYDIDNINNVVVASPGELNFITMNILLKKEDHVISVFPCYQSLTEVVKSIGCDISYWKPNSDNWEFNVLDLATLVKKNTKLIILNFPHNPTGAYLSRLQIDEIINLAKSVNAYIFSDEMYRKLIIDDTIEELLPICDIYEKGISLWGMSKTFGLAGLRIGWLVSKDIDFINKLVSFKDYLSICSSAPSEILALIALNNIDKFLLPNLSKIKYNIGIFEKFAQNNKIISSFISPKSGSTSLVRLNIKESSMDFSQNLVKNTSIMTVPAEMFEYENKYIRIGFGRKDFSDVLKIMDEYI